MFDECTLQRVFPAEPFDGGDVAAPHLRHGDQTRVDRVAVHEHRACAALPLPTAFLRSGEPAFFTQHVEQTRQRMRVHGDRLAIDGQTHTP